MNENINLWGIVWNLIKFFLVWKVVGFFLGGLGHLLILLGVGIYAYFKWYLPYSSQKRKDF